MSAENGNKSPSRKALTWRVAVRAILLSILFAIVASLILVFQLLPTKQVTLEEGDVSPVDIRAPRKTTYSSQILTEQTQAWTSKLNLLSERTAAHRTEARLHGRLFICNACLDHNDVLPRLEGDIRMYPARVERDPSTIVEVFHDAVHLETAGNGRQGGNGPARHLLRPHKRACKVGICCANRILPACQNPQRI